MNKKGIMILFIIVFLVSFLSGCTTKDNNKSAEWGDAPDFTLETLDGDTINLSDFKGKIVFLEFMGITCPYCVPQLIILEYIRDEYSKDDLEIITIDVYQTDSKEIFSALLESYRCKSPCYLEDVFSFLYIKEFKSQMGKEKGLELDWIFGMDSDGKIAMDYVQEYEGVPKIVIIDQNGNIYYSKNGYTEYSVLKNKLDELLD